MALNAISFLVRLFSVYQIKLNDNRQQEKVTLNNLIFFYKS